MHEQIGENGECEKAVSLRALFSQSWFCFALLGIALVFTLVDVPNIMTLKGAGLPAQPVVASVGRLVSAVVLFGVLWRWRSKRHESIGSAYLLAGSASRLCIVALVLACGMILSLSCALFDHPALSSGAAVFLGSLLLGCGNTLILVSWCEWLLRLDGRVAVRVVALALVVAGMVEFLIAALYIQLTVALFVVLPFASVLLLWVSRGYCDCDGPFASDSEDAFRAGRVFLKKWGGGLLLIGALAVVNGSMVTPSLISYGDIAREIGAQGLAGAGIALAGGAALALLRMSGSNEALVHMGMLLIPPCMLVLYVLALLFSDWSLLAILPMYAAKKLLFLLAFVGALGNDIRDMRVLYMTAYSGVVAFATIVFHLSMFAAGAGDRWIVLLQVLMLVVSFALFVGLYARGHFGGSPEGAGVLGELPDPDPLEMKRRALEGCGLTVRETEIALLLSEGLSSQSIAARLFLSPATVRTHASHIYAKVGVASQSELIVFLIG